MARTTFARNQAKKLIKERLVHNAPVPIEEIADYLHIKIEDENFPPDSTIDAMMLRRGAHASIVVNKDHHINRKRFSIAHEIGHFLLHANDDLYIDKKVQEQLFIFTRASGKKDSDEIEANQFAAELLMPSDLIKRDFLRKIEKREENFISKMAEEYQVSETALTYKLMNLKLI